MHIEVNTIDIRNYNIGIPRKKVSLEESLAGSHAYNPIRDSRRDSFFLRGIMKGQSS